MSRANTRGVRGPVPRCPVVRMLVVCAAAAIVLVVACEKKSVLEEAREEFEAGRYREAIYILHHHVKKGGAETPESLLLEGRCWLRLEVEADAEDVLARVVRLDSTYASKVAGLLHGEAIASMESGNTARGRRYVLRTVEYDSLLDFGRFNAIAGELLLERKQFGGAMRYLKRHLDSYPDTAGAAAVMLNLGEAYEGRGMHEEAIALYRQFKERYPKSRLNTTVDWKLENLLFAWGEELYASSNVEGAESVLTELARSASNAIVRGKVFFTLGQISEQRADFEQAIHFYTEVVHLNPGSSGRLVALAKERIEKLEQSQDRR